MQKNFFYTCLVGLLLSVAVGCAVKPYSKLLQVDGKNVNRILKLLPAKDGGSWCISDQGYGENAYFYISKLNAKSKIVWTKALKTSGENFIDACATNDGNLVFALRMNKGNTLYKISKQGKLLWDNSFVPPGKVIVLNAEDGIGITLNGEHTWLYFVFIDSQTGEIKQIKSTWSKNTLYHTNISILPDSTFVITGQALNENKSRSLGPTKNPTFYYILRIDKDANVIWKKEFENVNIIDCLSFNSNGLLLIRYSLLTSMDIKGDFLWTKKYKWAIGDKTILLSGNSYATLGHGKVNNNQYYTFHKINKENNIEWTKGHNIRGINQIIANKQGFLLAGHILLNGDVSNTAIFLQTDKLGNNSCFEDIDLPNKKGTIIDINDDKRFEEVTEEIMKVEPVLRLKKYWQLKIVPTELKKLQKVNMKMISVCPQDLK